MVARKTPLEEDDAVDILEHELLHGVHIEDILTEDDSQNILGGLGSAVEHTEVRDLDSNVDSTSDSSDLDFDLE